MSVVLSEVSVSRKKTDKDSIWINSTKEKDVIKLTANLLRFRDKDTRQIILFIPSLDITGYGNTEKKALEMLNFSVNEYFMHLRSLSKKKLDEELASLGWKKTLYQNKKFSKAFIDGDGNLQNFNAVADEVERLTVQAV